MSVFEISCRLDVRPQVLPAGGPELEEEAQGPRSVRGNYRPRGVPFGESSTNITTMVWTVNAPKVVLLSSPPLETQPGAVTTVNKQLKQLAGERGWTFLDASASARDGTQYADGPSNDGTKPNSAGGRVIGAAVKAAFLPAPMRADR